MEIFFNVWNNWTTTEKLNLLIVLLAILLIVPTLTFLFSRNKSFVLVSILSLIISGILTVISLFVLSQIFNTAIEYIYKLVPFTLLFVDILSLGTMIGYYSQNHKHRDFDTVPMKTEMQKDTVKLTVSLALFFTSIAIFTQSMLLPIILSLGLSLCIIWVNYLLLRKFFKTV